MQVVYQDSIIPAGYIFDFVYVKIT